MLGSNYPDIHFYDWPSVAHDQKWRHITGYSIFDDDTNPIGIRDLAKNKKCTLNGYLLPRPSYVNRSSIRENVKIDDYSVDFGDSPIDPNKGLWLKEKEIDGVTVWYKLHNPHPKQGVNESSDAKLIRDFIKVTDCLIHLYNDKVLTFHKKSNKYVCNKTFDELYTICEKRFDIDFVKREASFVLDQLNAAINMKESKTLHQGLLSPEKAAELFNYDSDEDSGDEDSSGEGEDKDESVTINQKRKQPSNLNKKSSSSSSSNGRSIGCSIVELNKRKKHDKFNRCKKDEEKIDFEILKAAAVDVVDATAAVVDIIAEQSVESSASSPSSLSSFGFNIFDVRNQEKFNSLNKLKNNYEEVSMINSTEPDDQKRPRYSHNGNKVSRSPSLPLTQPPPSSSRSDNKTSTNTNTTAKSVKQVPQPPKPSKLSLNEKLIKARESWAKAGYDITMTCTDSYDKSANARGFILQYSNDTKSM